MKSLFPLIDEKSYKNKFHAFKLLVRSDELNPPTTKNIINGIQNAIKNLIKSILKA